MKKLLLGGVALLVVVNLAGFAYKMGWLARVPVLSGVLPASLPGIGSPPGSPGTSPAAQPGSATGAESAGALAPASLPASAGTPPPANATDATGAALIAPPPFDGNLASLEFGGTVESWTTYEVETPDNQALISGTQHARWLHYERGNPRPGEAVLSFFGREPMVIDRVIFKRIPELAITKMFPKNIEIWVSTAPTPDGPYQKVIATALPDSVPGEGETTVTFPPVEARFLKLRALTNQSGTQDFALRRLKVMEAQRAGYVPLTTRHPELLWPGGPNRGQASRPGPDGAVCAPPVPPTPPSHPESRRVLILGSDPTVFLAGAIRRQAAYVNVRKLPKPELDALASHPDFMLNTADLSAFENDLPADEIAILTRATFRFVTPMHARPALLAPAMGYDTVVLGQMCNISDRMQALTPLFKQALMAWVAEGHKLIIQDSDDCVPGPDYGFVPYRFKTDTPGARGAPGFDLRFTESNQMLQPRAGRPGFLDVKSWVSGDGRRRYANELGDANVFTGWDANWCGQLAVRNVNGVTGFALAYAHYGRGLIIYDGFDNDQNGQSGYTEVVVRELAQGFDPDNLPCGARLGDFVITTDTSLLERAAVPGRTYQYPLTVLANLGYKGTVSLGAGLEGNQAAAPLNVKFEPATLELTGEGRTTMAVTLPATLPGPTFAMRVKGSDPAGRVSSLCLKFGPAVNGELTVASALAPPTKTRKNLEIILDASGSMKTVLSGKKTRWDVALETLDQVLRNLPDDMNVGLRIYGHRQPSTSPKTCTDSELIMAVQKLDRKVLMSAAKAWRPKGETPLVYSALQAPGDLKALGGGTVILITDGEESCKGDPVKAAADLKASGLDIRLNIVGFTLKNARAQNDLAGFAQGTGGLFYAADSGTALADAMTAAAVDRFPYKVYDAAGKMVLAGDAGEGSDQLPPGEYRVVVTAGTKELTVPKVTIAAGQSVTVTIAMTNGQLVLQ